MYAFLIRMGFSVANIYIHGQRVNIRVYTQVRLYGVPYTQCVHNSPNGEIVLLLHVAIPMHVAASTLSQQHVMVQQPPQLHIRLQTIKECLVLQQLVLRQK